MWRKLPSPTRCNHYVPRHPSLPVPRADSGGPVGVGKTFLAHAIGHIACRRGYSVLALRADQMLKNLQHARFDNSYDAELRKLISVDLLVVDDFCLGGSVNRCVKRVQAATPSATWLILTPSL